MQPGSILTIEEGAEFVVGEGKRFFVIDADNWGIFCYGRYLQQVPFVPRTGTYPNVRQSGESQYPYDSAMVDAKVIVNGTLTVKGSLYTSNGNASIVTENEKGKIQYVSAAPDATTVKESNIVNVDIAYDFFDITMNPAVLTNGNTTYPTLNTAGAAAGTNYNYCADCDRWYTGTHKIQVAFVDHDESSILSGEFCPNTVLTNKVTDPTRAADVQYKSYTFAGWSDGTNVYATNALPNATVDVTYTATYTPGELQIYEITWNINGTATTEEYTYGATPDCKAAITLPTAPDACHYYSFIGWATTEGGAKAYEEDELPTVTGAASYYAVYELVTDSNHNENVFAYVDNGDGETHTKKLACACGKVIDAEEAHDFTNGDCVCGAKKPATGLKGDVNQDGIVDQDDVIALLRHILKADIITDETVLAVSEVTGDTVLDQNDVLKILRYVLKAIDSLD